MIDSSRLRTVNTYVFNPACDCAWCRNGGHTPSPGAPGALGYDEPHIPPSWDSPSHLKPVVYGRPGGIFDARGREVEA